MNRGLFIAIEGGEGAGKTTQAEILGQKLKEKGFDVIVTREPGGTKIGEQIRAITHDPKNTDLDPVTESYLMAASRAQHVREVIEPALAKGIIVVADRYVDSNKAYQGYGRELGANAIELLNTMAVKSVLPDITLLLNVPPDIGLTRRKSSTKQLDRLDEQNMHFYTAVYNGYLELAKQDAQRYRVIDASKSIEEVAASVWSAVSEQLDKRNDKTQG